MGDPESNDRGISRRSWLVGGLAALSARSSIAQVPDEAERELVEIQTIARDSGLKPLRSWGSKRFRVLGEAPDKFLKLTLTDCEAVANDFFEYYQSQGFKVTNPPKRLAIVALSDDRAFFSFLGQPADPSLGGLYQRKSNRLILFDYRALPQSSLRPGYANLRTLAHEATHLLCFNCGILERDGDVPLAFVEGLAMLGEVRKFDQRSLPGRVNIVRLEDLAKLRKRLAWIPTEKLLTDDSFFRGAQGNGEMLLAYSQGWLLTYALMTDPARLAGFRNYLDAIKPRRDPGKRLEDARAHLGDLDRLDHDLQSLSTRLLKTAY